MSGDCKVCGKVTIPQLIKEHNNLHQKLAVFSKMRGEEAKWVTAILEGILRGE